MNTPRSSATPLQRAVAMVLRLKPVRAYLLYSENRGPMLADSVTYQALFSVFAAVLLGFAVAGLWLSGNPEAWNALVAAVDSAIPGLVGEGGLIDPAGIALPTGLGIAGVVSIVGLAWSVTGAIGSLRTAMRTIADRVHDDVLFVWVQARNLALGLGMGLALAASAAITFAGSAFVGATSEFLGLSDSDPLVVTATRMVSVLVTFVLDAAVIAVLFLVLSGVKASARSLWSGALLGGVGLTVLQQLSGLFVGSAGRNPLLASFASLIAILLWLNLSSQVVLVATAYIVTGVEEEHDRVRARHGARTFAQRRLRRAENRVKAAAEELERAREAEREERESAGRGD